MQEICWSTADARRLKKLRIEAGYDLVQFSKLSSVSVAQISQLEESGDSLFYSERIKYSVGKRLTLLLLKGQNSNEIQKSLIDEKSRNTRVTSHSEINAIAEMSRRNLDASPIKDFLNLFSYQLQHLIMSKYVLSSIGMVALMLALWGYEHQKEDGLMKSKLSLESSSSIDGLAYVSKKWATLWESQSPNMTPNNAPKMTSGLPESAIQGPVAPDHAQLGTGAGDQIGRNRDLSKTQTPSAHSVPLDNGISASAMALTEKTPINSSSENAKSSANDSSQCSFSGEGPEIMPTVAYKPSSYVYLEALADTVICLEDGQKKMNRLSLLAGSSKTVTGSSPWKFSIKAAQEVKVFYQGQRMQLPDASNLTFTLIEFRP